MAIGMTYEQYWYEDPLMVRAFYKADQLRRERNDEEAWLQGMYFVEALNAVVGNMFLKPGKPPAKYPSEPLLLQMKREKREKAKRDKEQEAVWAKAWMGSFVNAGKHWGKKG